MAADFLRSHGIDLDAELASLQTTSPMAEPPPGTVTNIHNVSLPRTPPSTRWDLTICNSNISSICSHAPSTTPPSHSINGHGALLAPSLCHPHVHVDKAYLLSHPKYRHLQIKDGDFKEAMSLTNTAKRDFETWDLLERGQRLIDESVAAGVTHMRAFVEVDAVVGMKCLEAGLELKRRAERKGRCVVQICAFAQMPLFTSSEGDESGEKIRRLMRVAVETGEVDVVGSTPYVEGDRKKMERNVRWLVELGVEFGVHVDFHLDYNLDADIEPTVWYVVKTLKEATWNESAPGKTVVLGHCTRLCLFSTEEWQRLKEEIGDLPISYVGLPTSDLFMMRTPERTRGTLDVPHLIKQYSLNACIGMNNIGNAFTPHGSCDPLTLACNGVGVYQAGTKQDAELLYECVSVRAKQAIGLAGSHATVHDDLLTCNSGDSADFVLFEGKGEEDWRTRRDISDAVYLYDNAQGRRGILRGRTAS